jgi:hypothetical protein
MLVAINRAFVDEASLWLNDSVSRDSLKMFTYLNLCLEPREYISDNFSSRNVLSFDGVTFGSQERQTLSASLTATPF